MEVILVIAHRELVCLRGVVACYAHVPKRLDHIIHSIIVGRRKTEHTGTSTHKDETSLKLLTQCFAKANKIAVEEMSWGGINEVLPIIEKV